MTWLGLAILLVFSLGLNLFMRLEIKAPAPLPEPLREWTRIAAPHVPADCYLERRVVQVERRFVGSRWVEQRRVRRVSDDSIVAIEKERPFRTPKT
jgi:hypothetical protein